MHDLDASLRNYRGGPGGALPYGMSHLARTVDLRWSDRQHRPPWTSRPFRTAGGAVRRWTPGWQGTLGTLFSRVDLREADVAVSIFENAGLALGSLRQRPFQLPGGPHVMIACWLAEDCQYMSERELRSVRRALRGVSRVVVFSSNQAAILNACLGIDPDRVTTVPFGVDTAYYDPALVPTPPGGAGVVAVGSDSRRDYQTLFEAARLAGIPVTVACQPRNIMHLSPPPNVTVRYGVYDADYRQLLHSADVVVTPTVAPAYPCGQSVVLEAMAMGKATITTDSPALRDYVRHGVDGVLIEAGNPVALATEMTSLLGNPVRRAALGAAARTAVATGFSFDQMWGQIAEVITALV